MTGAGTDKTDAGGTQPYHGSDLVVDILREKKIPFLAMNPGASFRGLHDSIVNYGGNTPELILVPHEKVAVGIAHGYAKATGEMMGVILHDLVGLLHGTMGVYYAYTDRAPMLILGGAGPMDQARRRPWIDWVHTANIQNTAVREYTKWDDHPFSVEAFPDSIERGCRIAQAQPQGPVYIALDADLQELVVEGERPVPVSGDAAPTPLFPDPDALRRLAEHLCAAERPMLILGNVGRDKAMWPVLVELVDLLGAGVVDTNMRHNFPNRHPLNVTGGGELTDADAVLLVDVKDVGQHTQLLKKEIRGDKPRLAEGGVVLEIGFGDLGISSWSADYGSLFNADVRILADTSHALPQLLALCRDLVGGKHAHAERRDARRAHLGTVHDGLFARWAGIADRHEPGAPMSTAHLVQEVGRALDGENWVLTAGTGNGWATKLWDFDEPHRHAGRSLGTATQIGISLGVGLAYRDDPDTLVVDLQPDGDLMFDASALWVATHHDIPMLVVMVNNRAYNNDFVHQKTMASERGNPRERASIGITIEDPEPDFAGVARSFGWWAEGPVADPSEIVPAVRRAIEEIRRTGTPALVDIICTPDE